MDREAIDLPERASEFGETSREPDGLDELHAMLAAGAKGTSRTREHAIACYLSGGSGWREAMRMLGGTFADGTAGLRESKAD